MRRELSLLILRNWTGITIPRDNYSETNLKRKTTVDLISQYNNEEKVKQLKGTIQCELPNERLLSFEGRLNLDMHEFSNNIKNPSPLVMGNMALRGSVLRNTEWTYSLVLYTGLNTKIIKNLKPGKLKVSSLEHSLNKVVIAAFIFNLIILAISVIFDYMNYRNVLQQENSRKAQNIQLYTVMWYIGPVNSNASLHILQSVLSFFAMYTYIIPISLFVTIEMARLAQATYMSMDPQMVYHDGKKFVPMRAANSNLNEDLGKIDFIFSDKTGTFTQNSMVMANWYVEGQSYDEMKTPGILNKALNEMHGKSQKIFKLFSQCLSLCHGVIPAIDEKTEALIYESQSPDETALLNAIMQNKYRLTKRSKNNMTVEIEGNPTDFEILDVIEFDSTRKRMTVIIRTQNDGIHVYCKGADNVMFERLSKSNNEQSDLIKASKALIEYSNVGLRTLVMCYKPLAEDEYQNFKVAWSAAQVDLKERESMMDKVAASIECEFILLGCTAIEDKLQDRVPETIEYLLRANIRLWLLTGDKQETAINIGMSSRLISKSMDLMILNAENPDACLKQMDEMIEKMKAKPDVSYF